MVFYHVWRWLVPPAARQYNTLSADWWLFAVRLGAAPLFILSFGCVLGVLHRRSDFASLRRKLWPRALQTLVVFKLLCFIELWARGLPWGTIHAALAYQELSNWYQVLNFYALFLALGPWVLTGWFRAQPGTKLLALLMLALLTAWGQGLVWDAPVLQGLLVGREPYLTFPLVPWSITALIGVWLGETWGARALALRCLAAAAVLVLCFLTLFAGHWGEFHSAIVFSGWKNPPHLAYVSLATAQALACLSACVALCGPGLHDVSARIMPCLGRHPLALYFFHVTFILVVFGMQYRHALSDVHGWLLAGATLALTVLVSRTLERLRAT